MLDNGEKEITRTLAIIKPDGMAHYAEIIDMIYQAGLSIEECYMGRFDDELLEEHYAHVVDKPFYPRLRELMLSGDVAFMVLSGEDAVVKLRDLMGPTDSLQCHQFKKLHSKNVWFLLCDFLFFS